MRYVFRILAFFSAALAPGLAGAHGINGHVWVTDGGIDYMRDCTAASILSQEAVRPVLQIGAAFPDSGYATDAGRDYGETAHWEPFITAFIDYMRREYAPPYDTLEEQQLIAFLMGAAAHGMEDETFDSIFLRLAEERDGVGQDWTDPGTDFMLVADHLTDLQPDIFLPADDLLKVYDSLDFNVNVSEEAMDDGMQIVRVVVIGYASVKTDPRIDDEYRPALTWTAEAYLDPAIPSSFPHEKTIIGPYLDAIWHRLHGEFRLEDVLINTVPVPGERLMSNDHTSAESYISLIFGYGVFNRSLNDDTVKLFDAAGKRVPVTVAMTRWGADGRMVQLRPQADLEPDAEYTAVLGPGVEFLDGKTLDTEIKFTFRSACEGGACAPLAPPEAPVCAGDVTAPTAAAAEDGAGSGCRSGQGAPALALAAGYGLLAILRRKHPQG